MYKLFLKEGKELILLSRHDSMEKAIAAGIHFRNTFYKSVPLWRYDLAIEELDYYFYF